MGGTLEVGTIVFVLCGFLVSFALLVVLLGIRMDREYERSLVFRLGRYRGLRGPGMFWVIPIVDQRMRVDIRTRTVDIESQETVTRDSVTIRVNAVLYYRITNPERAIISITNYHTATYQIALTTLRNVVGQHLLDEVLKDRDKINQAVRAIVDEVTDPWGLTVELVEMKDVEIPGVMQRAMAKEAEAAREKRSRLIKAESEQEAAEKLTQAADKIAASPAALELRRMQMISEVGIEQNTTTIILLPSDFLSLAKAVTDHLQGPSSGGE